MADSFLERKDRFLCITRSYVLGNNLTPVVEDIKIINERETPPAQYFPLSSTADNFERGTSKRLICVKIVERQAGMKCICDIIFLYRTRRPPQFYTSIGEINGLQMCVKEGTVPPLRIPLVHQPISSSTNDHAMIGTTTKKSDEKEMLDGVPFEINPKYLRSIDPFASDDLSEVDRFVHRSTSDIQHSFSYDFHLERSIFQF